MKNYTKAEALKYLNSKLAKDKKVIVPKFIFFEKDNYLNNKKNIIQKIIRKFSKNIILRSSAKEEDGLSSSLAGKYNSFKILKPNVKNLEENIDLIIKDFKNKKDQIIVQNFVSKMDLSGVIFTKDPRTGSDYFVVNYDMSGETNLVTSGSKNLSMKTIYVYKNKFSYSTKFKKILDKIKFIEKILPSFNPTKFTIS